MTTLTRHEPSTQRVVLIDFDWRDADLVPELLARPGLSVRLVAGGGPGDPGLRVAELCELPSTTDLADLTREIFDFALMGERSPRRTQIEGLLLALGTPCASPEEYLRDPDLGAASTPAVEAPLALHAAALEDALGGADFDALVEQALPDVGQDAPTAPVPVEPTGHGGIRIESLADFSSPEDRRGLERALSGLAAETGAQGAELRAARSGEPEVVARVGDEDPLMQGLIRLALELDSPQVVSRLGGAEEGRAWGAWPFRTTRSRGVLAAAAIDPASGWTAWQRTVDELRDAWDRFDLAQAAPAFPLVPDGRPGWLDPAGFLSALTLAVERNARDGLVFAVHCFAFPAQGAALDALLLRLPGQLRETDRLCRAGGRSVLLLTACPLDSFEPVRRRILSLWEGVWIGSGGAPPAPACEETSTELAGPARAESFVATATAWLSS